MRTPRVARTLTLSSALSLACSSTTLEPEPQSPGAQAEDLASTPPPDHGNANMAMPTVVDYRPLLREIAGSYRSWGMVDNQMHWAPGLCAMPAEGVAHVSTAAPPAAHAQKVFMLYASDAEAYWRAAGITTKLPASLGPAQRLTSRDDVVQVLVKDSFVAEHAQGSRGLVGGRVQPARRGDEVFVPGDPIGLFVMAQLRHAPKASDEGWIYGTVTPSGEVTAAGTIAVCVDCHDDEADRVFGMPLQWK
ncbi:MAG: hypothetical protein IAG13_31690 [Deltaproteobacteria bacterium]|nr:hypothetical protein [Nannocystaceae bacterium]